MTTRVCTCRFCGRDDLTPQGQTTHETWCDDNPNPGIPFDQQKNLGLLDEREDTTEGHPNPDQSVSEPSTSLPAVESLAPAKRTTETPEAVTDGDGRECPLCEKADVMDAEEAKAAYIEAVEKPHPKAVLGYELADHSCQNPECAALWGEEYVEPLPMEEIVNA